MSLTAARNLVLVGLVLLAGCNAKGQPKQVEQKAVGSNARPATLQLISDAFGNGQSIPAQYGCDGGDHIPGLHWGSPPQGTRSFALVIVDPDAPTGAFRHWGMFDIPASERSIGGSSKFGRSASNDFGKPGYSGPCPPRGSVHHYHFRLFALDVDHLGLAANASAAEVEKAAEQHAIGEGELIGTYGRN